MEKTVNDQELYERMVAPHASREAAEKAMLDFCEEVRALREKYCIPEVLVVCAATHEQDEKKRTMSCVATTSGSSDFAPHLAAAAYDRFAMPVIREARKLERSIDRASRRDK